MMGRHGEDKPLWPEVLGLFSAILVVAAIILLIALNPSWMPGG